MDAAGSTGYIHRYTFELESKENQWSIRTLERQYHSSLYERLALSRDNKKVMKLSNEGLVLERGEDVLKNPLVLEFPGLDYMLLTRW